MRRFTCRTCGAAVTFSDSRCASCETHLGFVHEPGDLLPIELVDDSSYLVVGHQGPPDRWWRCLNAAWGCNWMVPTGDGAVWCASCRLTRGRPDESSLDAVRAWSTAEAAKRRLVAQLHWLGLPIAPPSAENDDGLVFDLVYLPESVGVTGHRPGVITLDLREVDHNFREAARQHFREEYRTVLGHLRHETGHHVWRRLVVRQGALDEARALFGDERADYAAALESHYGEMHDQTPDTRPAAEFVSDYASVHPSEDWAECFAHYLHLRDGLETAAEFGLDTIGHDGTLPSMLERWRELSLGVDEVTRSLGQPAAYGVTIRPQIEPKLQFVHDRVSAVARER